MRVFVDSSAWLGLFDQKDQNYSHVKRSFEKIQRENIRLVTSEYIFIESLTLIRFRTNHTQSLLFGDLLFSTQMCDLIIGTQERFDSAWKIFRKYADQRFSFVDCTSFAIMEELNIREACTFDKDFVIAGFKIFS